MDDKTFVGCMAAASQVFGNTVNPDEAFFDLGGDSLHAIELVVKWRTLGVDANAYELVNAESLGAFLRRQVVSRPG